MSKYIAYDLGTGGVKASLFDERLGTLAKTFMEYGTYYPEDNMHEQRPEDWWEAVTHSTRELLAVSGSTPEDVAAVAISGHSLVAVPVGGEGELLLEQVPIWSDTRAKEEAKAFFDIINEEAWYMDTGNGFPAPCYSVFKIMWLKRHLPNVFKRIRIVLGSKDYINYRLTGNCFTDHSYMSGSGVYSLKAGRIEKGYLDAAGICGDIFPPIVQSHEIIGRISREAAGEMGLAEGTPVACGGVDNACMALGAVGAVDGGVYTSLGSSSWIAVNSHEPVLDVRERPYVFAHIQEGMFTSAYSIFAGGSSLRWVRDTICHDLSEDPYMEMTREAGTVPIGSGGIFFNPSLAGGTSQDQSVNIRGAFVGLHLGTTRAHMIHAAMEGIAMNLKCSYDSLKRQVELAPQLQFCGGGSKNKYWMQMFADIFACRILKTNIDQDAASLGAAAIAARAAGAWEDYSGITGLHETEFICIPNPDAVEQYAGLLPGFMHVSGVLCSLGDYLKEKQR